MNHLKSSKPLVLSSAPGQAGMPRRKFLALTGAAAAFTIVPRHVLGGPGHIAPSEKTTLAGIGMGGQGRVNMGQFLKIPEVQVVAVCDVNREGPGYLSWYWGTGQGSTQRRARAGPPGSRGLLRRAQAQRNLQGLPRLQRLPRVARTRGRGRGDDRHARPHARGDHDGRAQTGQARRIARSRWPGRWTKPGG